MKGDGKWKAYGSYGVFYDIMKLELPRGAFGGDKWIERYYTLDTLDYLSIGPNGNFPGTFIESVELPYPVERSGLPRVRRHRPGSEADAPAGSSSSASSTSWRRACRSAPATSTSSSIAPSRTSACSCRASARSSTSPTRAKARRRSSSPTSARPARRCRRCKRDYDALEFKLNKRFSQQLGSECQLHDQPALRQLPRPRQLGRERPHRAERDAAVRRRS